MAILGPPIISLTGPAQLGEGCHAIHQISIEADEESAIRTDVRHHAGEFVAEMILREELNDQERPEITLSAFRSHFRFRAVPANLQKSAFVGDS